MAPPLASVFMRSIVTTVFFITNTIIAHYIDINQLNVFTIKINMIL